MHCRWLARGRSRQRGQSEACGQPTRCRSRHSPVQVHAVAVCADGFTLGHVIPAPDAHVIIPAYVHDNALCIAHRQFELIADLYRGGNSALASQCRDFRFPCAVQVGRPGDGKSATSAVDAVRGREGHRRRKVAQSPSRSTSADPRAAPAGDTIRRYRNFKGPTVD